MPVNPESGAGSWASRLYGRTAVAALSVRPGSHKPGRLRRRTALGWFLLAGIYAIFAGQFAKLAATALASGTLFRLLYYFFLLLLLLAGFGGMGKVGQRQVRPLTAMGLVRRPGAVREWALGATLGWSAVVACVLPIALSGGLLVTVASRTPAMLGTLLVDLATLLLAALSSEVLFRGYLFQRLIEVKGPGTAAVVMTVLAAMTRGILPHSSPGSFLVSFLFGIVFAIAYLRTRALWVGWGVHFAVFATTTVLFGLPVGSFTDFSPVIASYTSGPTWLTGGGYGPEGSALALLVLLVLLFVLFRVTRELHHRWALPEIVGAGIPVDIDALSRRQHEEGMGPVAPAPAGKALVQIAPVAPPPPVPPEL